MFFKILNNTFIFFSYIISEFDKDSKAYNHMLNKINIIFEFKLNIYSGIQIQTKPISYLNISYMSPVTQTSKSHFLAALMTF